MIIKTFINKQNKNLFQDWYGDLDIYSEKKVIAALFQLENNNLSNVKSVGGGVLERKINFGKGIRIYFGRDGNELIILLCDGNKHRQQKDIDLAKQQWAEYKSLKKSQS
ncbi:MAG: type II toxin-antitoxin system RelE/ParE family toxin [Alphaproteobacteria bacterium]|nr:type II toxin-antitoxin system RelE/ParE family toxin [Alphaproteobacteria bacterium]